MGRPRRLSPEMIIGASIELLREVSAEGFTLARVAEKLDTVSMALYNYFPSREALLAEVANHISKQFRMPRQKPGQDWKKTLRDWLWTLRELGGRYPVIFKISGVDGKTSAGWLRITLVPGRVLEELGFRGKELALAKWLLCMQAHALVQAEVTDEGFHSEVSLSRLDELDVAEQAHFLALRPFHAQISGTDIMEQGFLDLIATIERKIPAR
ncbi:MAG: TetR/AcrR family transcriptional regulator [Gammaproteobacteria bacterium]